MSEGKNIIMKSKTVLLIHWEIGLYNEDEWEICGYSEYCGNIPKYAEIQRKTIKTGG